jgi:asparagine synthase (glutamine-hydrolysing)
MCGIAGVIQRNGLRVEPAVVRRMTAEIAHRGPDGEGVLIKTNVGLGHRRLAILDLTEAGAQPMVSQDGCVALSYNGEIYNAAALRSELEGLGYNFRSRTDSEVVLHAWHAWGSDCILRFNGMFAFGILDDRVRALYLVRDRYGVKPLYWAQFGATFLFGSEQRAINAHPHARSEPDFHGYVEYFTFQNFLTDRTLTAGIRLLPAGCLLRVDLDSDRSPDLKRYWDFDFHTDHVANDPRELREELDRLLIQAVSRQLIADVEVGSYLSGGMDSGAITALASRHLPGHPTFTIGFDLARARGPELAYDERVGARELSRHFGTEHHEGLVTAMDMARALPDVTRILEEPRVGQSYPNLYAARLASSRVKVVLSGVGSDELFAGYPWRYLSAAQATSYDGFLSDSLAMWTRLLPGVPSEVAFAPIWNQVSDFSARDLLGSALPVRARNATDPAAFINASLYFDAKVFLGGLLVVEDKLSMAQSLETRVPFLDNDLVDFAMACPPSEKLLLPMPAGSPEHLRRHGKEVLRDVVRGYLPPNTRKHEKQGFSAPDASWFMTDSRALVEAVIGNPSAPIFSILDYAIVKEMVDQHLAGRENRRLLIWSLLTVNEMLS